MNSVESRLRALERAGRRQRCAIAVLGGTLMLMMLGGSAGPRETGAIPDVLKAKRFEVVNEAGSPMVVLAQTETGGLIATQTPAGQLLVTLSSTPDGVGVLAVANARGNRLVELSGRAVEAPEAGSPSEGGVGVINTFGPKGEVAVSILASKGQGLVQAFNSRRQPAAMIGSVGDEGVVAVFDREGKVRQTVPADR